MDWERLLLGLAEGFPVTVLLVAVSAVIGNALAVLVALARLSRSAPVRGGSAVFVTLIRGTPLIVQMFMLYYGLSQFRVLRQSFLWPLVKDPVWCAVIALSISTAAYSGEVLRGAIAAVPRGTVEAARALGMRTWQIRATVILPLAIRQSLPVLANETVLLLKASAIVFTITVRDIMGEANVFRAQTFRVYEPLLSAAVLYLMLTFAIRRAFAVAERRMNRWRLRTG